MNTRTLLALATLGQLFLAAGVVAQSDAPSAAIGQEIFGPALAPPAAHEHPITPQEAEVLQRFDKNGDGRLDPEELDAAHYAMQQQRAQREVEMRRLYDGLLQQFDTTHQGHLDAEEQVQALEFLRTDRPQAYRGFVRQFDRNHDGKLNAAETAAVFQYLAYLPSTLGGTQVAAGKVAAGQGSGDMTMSGDAMAVGGEARPAGAAPSAKRRGGAARMMYQHLLQTFDHEHKGSLNPAEQAEAVAYLEQHNPQAYEKLLDRFDDNGDGKLDPRETQKMFTTLARLVPPAAAPQVN